MNGNPNHNRCVIITAGPMGPYDMLKPLLRPDDTIVCADGGLVHARALGVTPSVAVGDFDSAPAPDDAGIQVLRYPKEKDETDTILAIAYALDHGFCDILLLGGLRGRLDHTFANFNALMYLYRHGGTGYIADGENEAYLLPAGVKKLPRREGYYVSVFPFEGVATGVTERGLKYPLDHATLDCGFPLGVSNEFAADEAEISVKKGALLIILSKA